MIVSFDNYDKNYLLPRNQFCLWSLSIENVLRPLEIILIYKDMGNGYLFLLRHLLKIFLEAAIEIVLCLAPIFHETTTYSIKIQARMMANLLFSSNVCITK